METAGAAFTSYPTMSSREGDFARDNQQQQQTSSGYSQQRRIQHEIDYHIIRLFLFSACLNHL
jgi:hypothetical protein